MNTNLTLDQCTRIKHTAMALRKDIKDLSSTEELSAGLMSKIVDGWLGFLVDVIMTTGYIEKELKK